MNNDLGRKFLIFALLAIFAFGAFMRINPTASLSPTAKINPTMAKGAQLGFDEGRYANYLTTLRGSGFTSYPAMVRGYVTQQRDLSFAIIPPTRVTFIAGAYLWQLASRSGALLSLRAVSCLFTVLGFAVTAVFAWRMAGLPTALGITALMSCAPLQIQMAQRVYIDGAFAFWTLLTLWVLWESLRAPNHWGWLVGYVASLALMVMTKENAAFVFLAIIAIIALNRWIHFGKITTRLLIASCIGPVLGVLGLIVAAGGIGTLIEVYRLNIEKSYAIPYAIKTGDGPWFRYVLDLLTMSPAVTVLAIAGFFNVRRHDKGNAYFALFLASTYLIMANLRYGMNLRYASIWDMPLRWLAFAQLTAIAALVPRRFGSYFIIIGVGLLCVVDLNHYFLFFVQNGMYDPVPDSMLRILDILK